MQKIESYNKLNTELCDRTQEIVLKLFVPTKKPSITKKTMKRFKRHYFSTLDQNIGEYSLDDIVMSTITSIWKSQAAQKFLDQQEEESFEELSEYKTTKLANYLSTSVKNRKYNVINKAKREGSAVDNVLYMGDINSGQSELMDMDDLEIRDENKLDQKNMDISESFCESFKDEIFKVKDEQFNQNDKKRAYYHAKKIIKSVKENNDNFMRTKRGVSILCSGKGHISRRLLKQALVRLVDKDVIDKSRFFNSKRHEKYFQKSEFANQYNKLYS